MINHNDLYCVQEKKSWNIFILDAVLAILISQFIYEVSLE